MIDLRVLNSPPKADTLPRISVADARSERLVAERKINTVLTEFAEQTGLTVKDVLFCDDPVCVKLEVIL